MPGRGPAPAGLAIGLALALTGCGGLGAWVHELRADRLAGQGDYLAAIEQFRLTISEREAILGPDHPMASGGYSKLARFLVAIGDYVGARAAAEKSLRLHEAVLPPDDYHLGGSLRGLAWVLKVSGDPAGALPLYERAVRLDEATLGPDHLLVAGSVTDVANVLDDLDRLDPARALYERAYRIASRAHESVMVMRPYGLRYGLASSYRYAWPDAGYALHNLGYIRGRMGDEPGARSFYARALAEKVLRYGSDAPAVGWEEVAIGWSWLKSGDHAAARPHFETGLRILRRRPPPVPPWWALWGFGVVHEREGRLGEALRFYQDAVDTLEGLASQFQDPDERARFLKGDRRLGPYEALAALLLRLHEQDPARGYGEAAWIVLEARKGRLVGDALASVQTNLQELDARAEALRIRGRQQEVLRLEAARRAGAAGRPDPDGGEASRALSTLLAETKRDYLLQVEAFLARHPEYKAQFVDQHTIDPRALAKFGSRLPDGTLAVQYFSAPDALYVFVVTAGGRYEVRSVAVSQAELYGLIAAYRHHLDRALERWLPWADEDSGAYRDDVAPLKRVTRRLARALLEPIEPELARHPSVIMIPNDLLLYLPIHALTRAGADGGERFLAETHAVSYLTQFELVDLLSAGPAPPGAPLLAMGNPDGSLPAASEEIRALRRLRPVVTTLEGAEATKSRFLGLAPRFADLHLATHGILDPERPQQSYLVMAGEDEATRRLGIGEIAGLTLARNSLVILSACDTAVGEQVPGAALVTFAAAFSQAGSQSIVASLWKVSDAATRDFMVTLHRGLPQGRVAALQQAQLTLLGNPRTAHPYYWASFILIGAR